MITFLFFFLDEKEPKNQDGIHFLTQKKQQNSAQNKLPAVKQYFVLVEFLMFFLLK